MKMRKKISTRTLKRSSTRKCKGALQAEWAMTMYVLFLFFMFPMLDFAVLGLRAFFLWFACNQAVMVGCKAHTLVQSVTIGSVTYLGALNLSANRAANVAAAFPGTTWSTSYPQMYVTFCPLDKAKSYIYYGQSGPSGSPVAAGMQYTTAASPITTLPDMSQYVAEYECVILGNISPFIPVPLIGNVPGLSAPAQLQVKSTAQFENPPGLTL